METITFTDEINAKQCVASRPYQNVIAWHNNMDGSGFIRFDDLPSLESLKDIATGTVERNRDIKRYLPVQAHNRTWQADLVSKTLLSDAINLAQAGLPLPDEWRDNDNSNMAITSINDLLAIAGAMAAQTQAAYAWSWAKKADIEAATTVAELNSIDLEN